VKNRCISPLIYSLTATPPWLLKRPHINYNIHYSSKDNTSPEIYRNKLFEFCDNYKDFSQLYTDGSKMGNEVAAAVVHGNVTKTTRLPNKASIFRAELHGISLTLSLIRSRPIVSPYSSIFFFLPNLSHHILDVYHSSTRGVALVRI